MDASAILRSPIASLGILALAASLAVAEPEGMKPERLDDLVRNIWKAKEIEPVGLSDDAEFLRRVSFDLVGAPPAYWEADEFLKSADPGKRSNLIASLLSDERYGAYRASLLMGEIVEGRVENRRLPMESFESYFESSFNKDKPYDQLVSELISARGDSAENGATYLVTTHQANPEDLTGTVMRLFNGTQLRCVQCHDDKFGDWKQTDFWGTASFFARTGVRPNEKMGNRLVSVVVQERKRGEMTIPEGGITPNLRNLPKEEREALRRQMMQEMRTSPVEPSFLGNPVTLEETSDRRKELARLVTSPENPLFARSTVNRVWAEMFGKGLIEPVDDIHGKDAGDWEPVLAALSSEFVRSGHRLKPLYGLIARSQVYQISSRADEETASGLEANFARARLRAHRPEVLLEAIFRATRAHAGEELEPRKDLRRRVLSRFQFAFGNDEGNRSLNFEATIPQALMMMNDPIIEKALVPNAGSTLLAIGQSTRDANERVRLIYLAAHSREPSEGETADALEYLSGAEAEGRVALVADAKTAREAKRAAKQDRSLRKEAEPYQDLLWALMNTSEFLYNH